MYVACAARVAERPRRERGVQHAVGARAAALPPPARAADAVRAPPAAPRRRPRHTALARHIRQGEGHLPVLFPMSFARYHMET